MRKMKKIKVTFADKAPFVLEDKEQGILRRKFDKKGKQAPLEVLETNFVQGKIRERLLVKVIKEKIRKSRVVSKRSVLVRKVKSSRRGLK